MRRDSGREQALVVALAVVGHAVLFGLLAINLELMPRPPPQPVRLAIQATVVDSKALQRQSAARQRQQDLVEQRRREAEERHTEVERQRQEELRLAEEEKRKEQLELARKEDQQRKQAAEKVRLAKIEKVETDRQEAERQKREAAEAKRTAEAERRTAQAQRDLARQMAEEEDLQAAAESGLLDRYAEVIRQKVERNWIRPASARPGLNCAVLVKQIPGGEVVDVRVAECNGDAAVIRSIEAAVFRASPLPPPPNPSLFDRSLRFEFKPEE